MSFDLLTIFKVKYIMILVAFFLVSLFPFFFVKDQIASFQLKEIVVFLN